MHRAELPNKRLAASFSRASVDSKQRRGRQNVLRTTFAGNVNNLKKDVSNNNSSMRHPLDWILWTILIFNKGKAEYFGLDVLFTNRADCNSG